MEEILKQLGMNYKEFSEHYEIPYNTVRQWAQGTRKPPAYVLKLLNEKIERESKGEQLRIEDTEYFCYEYRRADNSMKYRAFTDGTEENKDWFNRRQSDWLNDNEQRIKRVYKMILIKETNKDN